jgi:hypothetical protein
MTNPPQAIWSGSFRVFDMDVHCYVLEGGQRIIEQSDFEQLSKLLADGAPRDEQGLQALMRWQREQE